MKWFAYLRNEEFEFVLGGAIMFGGIGAILLLLFVAVADAAFRYGIPFPVVVLIIGFVLGVVGWLRYLYKESQQR
jgi:NhaP-type Na+/H+ and K+/H+ antiporter